MNKDQLIDAAYKWVLSNGSCTMAFKELKTQNDETPDVIGFGPKDHSVLIECVKTHAEFIKDRDQFEIYRVMPYFGMGSFRFYCCPTGIIKPEELPRSWALIYVDPNVSPKAHLNPMRLPFDPQRQYLFSKNTRAERIVMYTALRKLRARGHLQSIYAPVNKTTNVIASNN